MKLSELMKILCLGAVHSIKELEVSTRLVLNSQKDYLEGDNSDIVATGTFSIIDGKERASTVVSKHLCAVSIFKVFRNC